MLPANVNFSNYVCSGKQSLLFAVHVSVVTPRIFTFECLWIIGSVR